MAIAGQARAASSPDDLVHEGVEHRRHGDDAGALRLFQEAYDKGHSPRALAQMALAEQALGKWVAASEHIRQALAERDPWIVKNRAALNESAARVAEHVGQIDILGGTPGAEVRLDGAARGILPLRQPLAATTGTVTIDILMRGRLPVRRTTSVRAGEVTRESFDALATATTAVAASLVEDSDKKKGSETSAATRARAAENRVVAEASPSAESAAGAANLPEPSAPGDDAEGEPSRPRASRARMPLVLVTGGLSLAALAFAIVEHVSWSSKVDSFEKMDVCSTDRVDNGGSACDALFKDGRRARSFAFVGYGAAGALAVTSAVLFFALPDGQPDGRIACSINPARPSVGCAIRF